MIQIGIYGASGKMGQMIASCLKESKLAKLSVVYDKKVESLTGCSAKVAKNLDELFNSCDVVIDFTINDGTKALLNFAKNHQKPLCIGTTGLDDEAKKLLNECAKTAPILYATNMSLGVAIANKLVAIAAKALRDFDIEIVEMHHKHKKDAPSGTALTLATTAANARGLNLKDVINTGRDGLVGERKKDEIAVLAKRGGDIVGEHDVGFYGEGEYLQVLHTATSRATFANGAIKAALWLVGKKPGLYSIDDCLGI